MTDALAHVPCALIADALGGTGVLPAHVRPIVLGAGLLGPAFTLDLPAGDNLGLHVALAEADAGSVIVARVAEDAEWALWGGIMARAAAAAGLAGLVTDGYVRDRDDLAGVGIPVFARGTTPRRAAKRSAGRRQVPVTMGAATVRPGDLMRGDADGVVAIPRERIAEIASAIEGRVAAEQRIVDGIAEGRTTLDLLGLEHPDTEGDG